MSVSAAEHFIDPFDRVCNVLGAQPRGNQVMARCPAHEDGKASLSVSRGDKGVVLYCQAGCTTTAVVEAMGLRMSDLFNEAPAPRERAEVVSTYNYYDEHGELLYRVVRTSDKKFWQQPANGRRGQGAMKGVRLVPYRLPEVLEAIARGERVWIAEGEKDVDALWNAGVAATCNTAGAGKWKETDTAAIRGVTEVTIVADKDQAGYKHADDVRRALEVNGVAVTVVEAAMGKDAADHLGAGKALDEFVPIEVAGAAGEGDELDDEDDWAPIDLVEIARKMMAGTIERTVPTVFSVEGASPLFYENRINCLFGESGGGKTWLSLAAAAEVAKAGDNVLFVDYEDSPLGAVERLLLLGLTPEQIGLIEYVNPVRGIGHGLEALEKRAEVGEFRLAILDSTGEAMAAGGIDENDGGANRAWFKILKALSARIGGPAICVLDHIGKSKDAPALFALGSQAKRAAITGAAYRVDTVVEPAKGKNGQIKLTVAKDRFGNRPKGSTAAVADIVSTETSVAISLHLTEAQEAKQRGEAFRPTVLMERVSRFVESNPGETRRKVEQGVTGKAEGIRQAIDVLIDEGYFDAQLTTKPGMKAGTYEVFSVRAYRKESDARATESVVDLATRPDASPRVPNASRDAGHHASHASPPLQGDTWRDASDEQDVQGRVEPDPLEFF